LYLFTNGDGTITPHQSGDLLTEGQTYYLTAMPGSGYEFSSWQPINVFIYTQTNIEGGEPVVVQTILPSPVPTNINGATLAFTMQAPQMLTADGQNPNIVEAFGWQADFVPLPPTISLAASSGGLVFNGTNCPAARQYRILASACLLAPLANWEPIYTNTIASDGTFSCTNAIGSTNVFFMMASP
jgi:hypothetical protein